MTHGTRSCYTYHRCRCPECREANTAYTTYWQKKRRPRRHLVPAVETKRMVRELKEQGFTQADIAEMLGYKRRYLTFMAPGQKLVTARNEERVRVVHRYFVQGAGKGEG